MFHSHTIPLLVGFQVRWRAHSMKIALMRYKLFMVFSLLMLASSLDALKKMLLFPTYGFLSEASSESTVLLSLISYQCLGMLWFILNQAIQINSHYERYLASLPLSYKQLLISDLCVLFIWNLLLWLPLGLATLPTLSINLLEFGLSLTKCIFSINFILLIQLALKNKSSTIIGLTFIIDFIAASFSTFPPAIFLGILIILICCSFPFYFTFRKSPKSSGLTKLNRGKIFNYLISFLPSPIFAKIQLNHLLNRRFLLTATHTLFLTLFTISAILLIGHQINPLKASQIASLFALFNALMVSHLFVRLSDERAQYFFFLNALPIQKFALFLDDICATSLWLLPCNLMLLFFTYHVSHVSLPAALFNILFIPYCFLSASYYPQITFKKFGFFIALFIMLFFAWLTFSYSTF